MAARRPFWKWHHWKSIGFCLCPPSTCIWNLKLKFQSKLDLCSGNHVVYRQTDGQTDGQGESSIHIIWSLKLKFQSKLDLHPGNLVTYRVQKPKNLIWPPGHIRFHGGGIIRKRMNRRDVKQIHPVSNVQFLDDRVCYNFCTSTPANVNEFPLVILDICIFIPGHWLSASAFMKQGGNDIPSWYEPQGKLDL